MLSLPVGALPPVISDEAPITPPSAEDAEPLDDVLSLLLESWLGRPALPKIVCAVTPGRLSSGPKGLAARSELMSLEEVMLPLMVEFPVLGGVVLEALLSLAPAGALPVSPPKEAKGLLPAASLPPNEAPLVLPVAAVDELPPDRPLKSYGEDDPLPAATTKALLLPSIPTLGPVPSFWLATTN